MSELTDRWRETAAALREAARAIPPPTGSRTQPDAANGARWADEFEEFLSHNELGLAWDVLAEAAGERPDTALVWFNLAHAAALMRIEGHKERAVRRLVETWPALTPYRLGYVYVYPASPAVPLPDLIPRKVPG